MSVEIEKIERIHRFLSGEMSDAELSAFRQALRTDPDLRADLELQKLIYSGAEKTGEADLRLELEGYYQTYTNGGGSSGGINPAGPALILPAVLLTVAALVFYFMPADSETESSETEKQKTVQVEESPKKISEKGIQEIDFESVNAKNEVEPAAYSLQIPTYQSFSDNAALARAEASDRGFIFYGFRPAGSIALRQLSAGKYILQTADGCFELKPDKSPSRPCDCPESLVSLPLAYPSLIRKNEHSTEVIWQHDEGNFRWPESPEKGTGSVKIYGKNSFKNLGIVFLPEKKLHYLVADGKLYTSGNTEEKLKPASESDKNALSRLIYEQIYQLRDKPEIRAEFERSGRSAESNEIRFSVIFRPADEQARALLFQRTEGEQTVSLGPGGLSVLTAEKADARPPVLVETKKEKYVLSSDGKAVSEAGAPVSADIFLSLFLKKHQSSSAETGFEVTETEFKFAPDRTLAKNLPEIRFYENPKIRITAERADEKACIRLEGPKKPAKLIFFRLDDKLILQADRLFFDYTNNSLLTENQLNKLNLTEEKVQAGRLFLSKK